MLSKIIIDTLIIFSSYNSYYSFEYKAPLLVSYKLYKGGGDCSRDTMYFKSNSKKTATSKDYSRSGFDKGHLANAEDFANNCVKELETFYYWNCVPQTPELNRGIFKSDETLIRNLSQNDSLYVFIGNLFENKKIIGRNVHVPTRMCKIVYSLSKKKFIFCKIYLNNNKPTSFDINIDDLYLLIGNDFKNIIKSVR